MRFIFTFIILLSIYWPAKLKHEKRLSPPSNIKTVVLQELGSEKQVPLIQLGKTLSFSFDDINGDEADYYYKISHCNFDWTPISFIKK